MDEIIKKGNNGKRLCRNAACRKFVDMIEEIDEDYECGDGSPLWWKKCPICTYETIDADKCHWRFGIRGKIHA